MQIPDDLRYSTDHEWIRVEGGTGPHRDHRLRPGRARRRRVRRPARGGRRGRGGRVDQRGGVHQVGVRHLRAGVGHGHRGQHRPGRCAGAAQRGPLRRGVDLRDRAQRRRRSSTSSSAPTPTARWSRASRRWPTSAARSAGTGTRWARGSARRAVPASTAGEAHTTMSVTVPDRQRRSRRWRSTSRSCRPGVGMLVVTRGPNSGSRYALDEPLVTAGRHPDSVIFLDDITVSRRHAEVRQVEGGYEVATSARSTAPTSTASGWRRRR